MEGFGEAERFAPLKVSRLATSLAPQALVIASADYKSVHDRLQDTFTTQLDLEHNSKHAEGLHSVKYEGSTDYRADARQVH